MYVGSPSLEKVVFVPGKVRHDEEEAKTKRTKVYA
jgi:hypothetical protein